MNTQPNFHTRRMSERPLGRARQSGAALLVLLTLVVLVGASAMLSQVNQTAQLKAEDQANTMEALSSAKAALIAYAVSDEDRPGELPCPDVDNNGKLELGTDFDASGVCTTMRGWFPWQTLKASDLRDGAEERLWYALSTDFRAGNAAVALNSETAGQLTVDTTTDDIVAVIITPGAAFDTQNGRNNSSPDANTHADEWLEATNQDADLTTYATEHSGPFNDQVLILTRAELMGVVEKRVLGEVSVALTDYRNTYNAYPWLSPFADPRSSTLTGTASPGSAGVTLSDTSTDFINLGVRPGDAVQNTTDGSSGIIATVTSTSVTVNRLLGGASNTFSPGDAYHFSRYNGVVGATEGHLPFHETDESFTTNFIADWNLQDANGNDVSTGGGGIGQYLSSLQQFVESTAVSGAVPVALSDGACTWTADTDLGVRCTGRFTLTYFEGTATTDDDDRLKDKSLHFDDWGAVTGAWVENLDDGDSWGIVKKVNNNKLKLEDDLQDGINNEFVAGDRYRVHIPSQTTSTTTPLTADGASSNETLVDNDQDFIVLGVEVGDTIYNVDDKEWGRITVVGTDTLQAQDMDFDGGEEYYIRYDFVEECEYEIVVDFVGLANRYSATGTKRRDGCSNDLIGCTISGISTNGSNQLTLVDSTQNFTASVKVGDMIEDLTDGSGGLIDSVAATTLTVSSLSGGLKNKFKKNHSYRIHPTESLDSNDLATMVIRDRDTAGNVVGAATATVPSIGSPTGTVYVKNIYVDLEVEQYAGDPKGDIPIWFTQNNWHRLVYVAASSGVMPGAGGTCIKGSDCLTVAGLTPTDDKRVLAIMAGLELASQNRSAGSVCGGIEPAFFCDYFEGENADFDFDESGPPPPTFYYTPATTAFNDLVRIVAVEP